MKTIYHRSDDWFTPRQNGRPNRAYLWNDTFGDGLLIFWGIDSDTLVREYMVFNKGLPPDCQKNLADFKIGEYYCHNNVSCIAFRDSKPGAGLIAHECLHAVNALAQSRGVSSDPDNDETHAYLLHWLVDNVSELVNHKRFKS